MTRTFTGSSTSTASSDWSSDLNPPVVNRAVITCEPDAANRTGAVIDADEFAGTFTVARYISRPAPDVIDSGIAARGWDEKFRTCTSTFPSCPRTIAGPSSLIDLIATLSVTCPPTGSTKHRGIWPFLLSAFAQAEVNGSS